MISFSRCCLLGLLLAIIAGFTAAFAAGTPGNASVFHGRHVLIIGVDGTRSDALKKAVETGLAPNLKTLIAGGTVNWNAYAGGELHQPTQQPTISGPGWTTILTGVWMNKHHVHGNASADKAPYNSTNGYHEKAYPPFFKHLKDKFPGADLASICSWHWINDYMLKPYASALTTIEDSTGADAAGPAPSPRDTDTKHRAAALLTQGNPDVLFVHLDEVDETGHASGFSPDNPDYLAAIHNVDDIVGALVNAIRRRPQFAQEKWLVLVLPDHGGIQRSHGGQSPEERTIFMIANGEGVPHGVVLTQPVGQAAIAPTVFQFLGVPVNPAWGWEGRPFALGGR